MVQAANRAGQAQVPAQPTPVEAGQAEQAAEASGRHAGPARLAQGLVEQGDRLAAVAEQLVSLRQPDRPLPPAGSPNVLFIVLDTVRADHLSLYGYPRATSPTLEHLAQQGIRFDAARATAPSARTLP